MFEKTLQALFNHQSEFFFSLFLRFAQEVLYLTHLLALVTNYSLVIYFKSTETK